MWEYFNVGIGQTSEAKCNEVTMFALKTLPPAQVKGAVLLSPIDSAGA